MKPCAPAAESVPASSLTTADASLASSAASLGEVSFRSHDECVGVGVNAQHMTPESTDASSLQFAAPGGGYVMLDVSAAPMAVEYRMPIQHAAMNQQGVWQHQEVHSTQGNVPTAPQMHISPPDMQAGANQFPPYAQECTMEYSPQVFPVQQEIQMQMSAQHQIGIHTHSDQCFDGVMLMPRHAGASATHDSGAMFTHGVFSGYQHQPDAYLDQSQQEGYVCPPHIQMRGSVSTTSAQFEGASPVMQSFSASRGYHSASSSFQSQQPQVIQLNPALGEKQRQMQQQQTMTSMDNLPQPPPPPYTDQSDASKIGNGLVSIGSAMHDAGKCKPCAFLYTKGCENGINCPFCHLCEPGEKKKRRKDKVENRRVMRHFRQALTGGLNYLWDGRRGSTQSGPPDPEEIYED
jgi:hypothetical protein